LASWLAVRRGLGAAIERATPVSRAVLVGSRSGDAAIRKAVEFAEDDFTQAWTDLSQNGCNANDMVVGIAASGRTPYVVGGLRECQKRGIATGCIVCNPGSPGA